MDLDGNTPLHLAVKGENGAGFHKVAKVLLQHKANPNKPIITPSGNSTPLMEACMNEDTQMVDLLLKFEATDDDGTVLQRAIESLNEDLAGVFLKHRSHFDSENTVNRLALVELIAKSSPKR
jgi:ankyrin repeat protein